MDQQDKAFMTVFSAVLGILVLVAVFIFILAQWIVDDDSTSMDSLRMEQAVKYLKKPGRVIVNGTPEAEQEQAGTSTGTASAAGATVNGAEVYQSACAACHTSGVLDAPKLGDNAEWTTRHQKGMDTLLKNATQGFNQMPPQSPGVPEEGVKAALDYMLSESGVAVAAPEPQQAQQEPEQSEPEQAESEQVEPEQAESGQAEPVQAATIPAPPLQSEPVSTLPISVEAVQPPPMLVESVPTPPVQAEPVQTSPVQAATIPAPPLQSEPVPTPPVPVESVQMPSVIQSSEPAAADPQVAAATETQAEAAVTETQEAPQEEARSADSAMPTDLDLAQGQQTYENVCRFCHMGNLPTAPKLGDKEAWAPRIAAGWETLKTNTLNGTTKGMPPKGGRPDLSDEQILNALGYMINNSQ